MAIEARRQQLAMVYAVITAFNSFKRQVTKNLTTYPHADITSRTTGEPANPGTTALTITSANASDLPTVITLANEAKDLFAVHAADAVAHEAADTANAIAAADASDQSTSNTLLNELKADYNLHLAQSGVHFTNDTTNAISAANASDLATSITLANALKTAWNAHVAFALSAPSVKIVEA